MMVRSRVPGGKVTAAQFLSELDLCDRFGNGTLRITTRQGFQLHGVLKGNLRETIREINRIKLIRNYFLSCFYYFIGCFEIATACSVQVAILLDTTGAAI